MNYTLLGKKLGMTQIYDGTVQVSVTVIQAGPCPVLQVKTTESDGYNAIQIGYETKKEKRASKAERNHAKKHGVATPRAIREVRCDASPEYAPGDVLDVTKFEEGQKIDIIGTSKGRGFQGVMKRFNVKGGPASHGSMFHRRIGSIGLCQWPGHVFKNQKMPGRMGGKQRTVQNLRVMKIDAEKNLILVKGGIPGANGDTILVRSAIKGK
ncbi:MAG: 50S ribosomal protein L3 [Opitutales bacterium]|jgi:large subunit ribosomal protein L3|nr:50S ribosomal protein L3 [Opitutales bacterium]MDG2253639.1 50S ribosomal protein L3 [Opitutaceae bacterium]MBT5166872.1 50S ribosomal protein L3 [Opitutales bacterium]MBT5814375.1 50S ribosomal protein L3 [Opitutales bacterium]MBT6381337.1 50S ribosomal protein L3 [Opitutales bacterium]